MPIREVAKYQQTFNGTVDNNDFTFTFYRVFKQNQKNKFRVRVVQLADYRDSKVDNLPHAYFASDLAKGTSTYSEQPYIVPTPPALQLAQFTTGMRSNEFLLGVVMPVYFGGTAQANTSGTTQYLAPELILDEISTSPFTVQYRHVGSDTYAAASVGLLVCFEITEIEEVPY